MTTPDPSPDLHGPVSLYLSSRSFPEKAHVRDYDHWIGYVVQHIEEESGCAVDETQALSFGAASETFARVEGGSDGRAILEAVQRLWARFQAEEMPAADEATKADVDAMRWLRTARPSGGDEP